MLQNGSIVKLWEFEDKGKYSVVSLSQSQKDKQTGNYVTKFSSKFVRFIGAAHDKLKQCSKGERVKIVNFVLRIATIKRRTQPSPTLS